MAFLAAVAFTFLVRPMAAFADAAARTVRRSPLSALAGMLFLAVFVVFAGEKPTPPGPSPEPEPVVTNHVTYVLNGGVNSKENPTTFTTNDLPKNLLDPTRADYIFTGWLPSGTIPVGTVTDVTYTATWEAIPPPDPDRQPWPEASKWERIDLDAEHTIIENEDKSRRNSAIPVETEGDVIVPDVLKLHRVVSIGTRAFDGCSRITSVDIPEGVTNIADYAFYNCTSLTNVVFPSTLRSIGEYAFDGCANLARVSFAGTKLAVGKCAFVECNSISTVELNADEIMLGEESFAGCGKIGDFTAACKVVEIGPRAFNAAAARRSSSYCDSLTNVQIIAMQKVLLGAFAFEFCRELSEVEVSAMNSIDIGMSAFRNCPKLLSVEIAATNSANIGQSAFQDCGALAFVGIVATNSASIGQSAFQSCTALAQIALPSALGEVQTNVFNGCTNLCDIALPSSVATILYRAFDTCTSLTNVCLNEGLSVIEPQAFYGCALKRLDLPQSVSSVGSRAFEMCRGLESVLLREGDTNLHEAAALALGERAFYRCDALTDVRLPQRATVLPARVFADCEHLVAINLPSNLTDIAESAFESCAALPYVDFPKSLASIGAMSFNGCAALTGFSIPTNRIVNLGDKAFVGTKYWNEWPDNSLVENNGYILGFKGNPTSVALPEGCVAIPAEMFKGMTALTNVVVPASVKKVGLRAFAGSGVLTLALPSATEIGVSAFEGCANLTAIVLAEGLGEIPDSAFRKCPSLLAVDIPGSVISIGAEAFRDCIALRDVTGGEGVERVGDYAFAGCVSLQPFRFPQDVAYGEHVFQGVRWTENVLFPSVGTMAQEYPQTYMDIKSVVISSTLTGIVDRACAGCASLGSIVLPDGVRSIGVSAFEGCVALTSVVLPASVSNVGSNAFRSCTSVVSLTTSGLVPVRDILPERCRVLTDIRIADEATSLCGSAFAGCSGLAEIVVPIGVESIGDFAFEDCVNLKAVKFMGPQPSANPNIYAGTSRDLVSKVNLNCRETWLSEDGKTLQQLWPVPDEVVGGEYRHSRRVSWWTDAPKDDPDDPDDPGATIAFYYYDTTGTVRKMSPEEGLGEIPDREGYDFAGWWTMPYGGVEVTEDNYRELGMTKVYAHWVRNRDDHDDPQSWDDVMYDVAKSCTYDGYLLDGDAVVGTVQLKMAKGKYDRENECYNVSVTAKAFILGEGKNISFKGVAEDVGEDGGSADLVCTKKSDERELSVNFTATGLDGSLDGYEVVAARNLFAYSTDWDRRAALAAVDDCGGTHTVVLKADGDDPLSNGYAALAVNVGSKGKTKVSGTMPDGTKVSVSSQLLILPDTDEYVVPVVVPLYSGKKGGFGFGLRFLRDEEFGVVSNVTVFGATEWTANPGKANEFVSTLTEVGVGVAGNLAGPSAFEMEGAFDVDAEITPDGTPVTPSGTKWVLPKADKVKFDRESESYDVTTDYENPAGLKLTYTAKSGTFKGSFKVYAVTDAGKSKKYTANVTGAVLDGVGYGTATIKKVGSVPVIIQPE